LSPVESTFSIKVLPLLTDHDIEGLGDEERANFHTKIKVKVMFGRLTELVTSYSWVSLEVFAFVIYCSRDLPTLFRFFVTSYHVSQIYGKVGKLYSSMNHMHCRFVRKQGIPFKTLTLMRLCMKELGAPSRDGHFVFGLSDGNGPAITRMEIFHLIMETICNTLQLMTIFESTR
jgi:hypothetical protein